MDGLNSSSSISDIFSTDKNTLTLKVGNYLLTLKIEGPKMDLRGRLRLEQGKTMFDLVLEAAREYIRETGETEFTAAVLYHLAREKNPGLTIRKHSWNSHVIASAPKSYFLPSPYIKTEIFQLLG